MIVWIILAIFLICLVYFGGKFFHKAGVDFDHIGRQVKGRKGGGNLG